MCRHRPQVWSSPVSQNRQVRTPYVRGLRRTLATLAPLLSRIEATERHQLKQEDAQVHNEERFKLILVAFSSLDKSNIPDIIAKVD